MFCQGQNVILFAYLQNRLLLPQHSSKSTEAKGRAVVIRVQMAAHSVVCSEVVQPCSLDPGCDGLGWGGVGWDWIGSLRLGKTSMAI